MDDLELHGVNHIVSRTFALYGGDPILGKIFRDTHDFLGIRRIALYLPTISHNPNDVYIYFEIEVYLPELCIPDTGFIVLLA